MARHEGKQSSSWRQRVRNMLDPGPGPGPRGPSTRTLVVILLLAVCGLLFSLSELHARHMLHLSLSPGRGHRLEDDVVLIRKAGAATAHKRLLVHILESPLSANHIPHQLYVADYPLRIATNIHMFDATANMSARINAFPEFAHMRKELHGLIQSAQSIDHTRDKEAGWKLDKYKFLPMMAEAYRRFPHKKWYVLVEADTFLFWNNLIRWLAQTDKDHTQQLFFGHPSFVDFNGSDTMFAHGGSGFVLSRALMDATFGADPEFEFKHDDRLFQTAYGDAWLARALYDTPAVTLNNQLSPSADAFRDGPPREQRFDSSTWCQPILTFHHVSPLDNAHLYDFQRRIEQKLSRRDYIRFADIWDEFLPRFLKHAQRDALSPPDLNLSDIKLVRGAAQNARARARAGQVGIIGWESIKEWDADVHDVDSPDAAACQDECRNHKSCLMWSWNRHWPKQDKQDGSQRQTHTGGRCRWTSEFVRIGNIRPHDRDVATGWIMGRIHNWRDSQSCSRSTRFLEGTEMHYAPDR